MLPNQAFSRLVELLVGDEVVGQGPVLGAELLGRRLGLLGAAHHVEARVAVAVARNGTQAGGDGVVRPRLDLHVVRRVGVDQVDGGAVEQPVHVLGLAGVAAQQAVLAEEPQVAGLRDRLVGRLGDVVGVGPGRRSSRTPAAAAARRRRSRSGRGRSPSPGAPPAPAAACRRPSSDSVAVWLSAMRYALAWAGVRPTATWTGTSFSPSFSAAL